MGVARERLSGLRPDIGRSSAGLGSLLALIGLAAGLIPVLAAPAYAIPSPDLAVNLFSSVAQLIGLATVVGGVFAVGRRRMPGGSAGSRAGGKSWRWLAAGVGLLLLGSLAGNVLQYVSHVDDANRRLQANLVRPSKEAGKSVGDVNLKSLSYSDQLENAAGISTDEFAAILSTGRSGGTEVNLIDLREPEEQEVGALPQLERVRFPDLTDRIDELGLRERENILFCESGNRSSESCAKLAELGIPCKFVVGGFEKWKAENRPVVSEAGFAMESLRDVPDFPNKDVLLDTPEIARLVAEENALFVDVRYPQEFESWHLPGAVNVPLRRMKTDEMWANLKSLPKRPIIGACYDKRSCFYSLILGVRLSRLGYDFRGRYSVPFEYFVPPVDQPYVMSWKSEQDQGLMGVAAKPLRAMTAGIADTIGSLPLAILAMVVLLRLVVLPFTAKSERDQEILRRIAGEIAGLKERLKGDPTRLGRATQALYRRHRLTPGRNLIGVCLQVPLFIVFFVAVDAISAERGGSFGWIPALGDPDPHYVLPTALGVLIFLHLHLTAAQRRLAMTALRAAAGIGLGLVTLQLAAGVNLYLVLSVALMMVQAQVVRGLVGRRLRESQSAENGATDRSPLRVVPLAQADRVDGVGNKALRLAQMMRAGLPVPQGLVITDLAFAGAVDGHSLTQSDSREVQGLWQRLGIDQAAVRSSGAAEDGADRSFAGVYDSILGVGRDELSSAVRAVRESMRRERATAYGGAAAGGGVIVQQVVDAEHAGVLFTEHPGEAGTVLVEMTSGLGTAAVTDGSAVPDAFRFGRLTGQPLDDSRSPIDLAPLLKMGRRAERLFGAPQDIEWTYRDGKFYLLQSRNVTAAVRLSANGGVAGAIERDRHRLLASAEGAGPDEVVLLQDELAELLPRPTPLSLSFMESLWRPGGSVDLACRYLGVPYAVQEDSPALVTTVFGALYIDAREKARRFRRGPGIVASFRLAREAERIEAQFREDFLPGYRETISLEEAIDLGRLDTDELFQLYRRVRRRFVEQDYVQAEIVNLAAGFYLKQAEQGLTRRGLSVVDHLAHMPATIVHQAMSLLPEIRAGRRPVASFLNLFGHRAPVDYELADPRYAEDPALVEQLVASARDSQLHASRPEDQQSLAAEPALRLVVERARRFQALKEEAKHHCLRELALIRRILLELDRRLELGGGIFYLTWEEIDGADREGADHLGCIAARRADAAAFETLRRLPTEITAADLETLGLPGRQSRGTAEGVLHGTLVAGAAPVEGRARVVTNGDAVQVTRGEILVARHIHPDWIPLFPDLAGMVVELGGWLSHGAVIAREYDLPTVVGVRGATDRISDGDLIRIEADGRVERLLAQRATIGQPGCECPGTRL